MTKGELLKIGTEVSHRNKYLNCQAFAQLVSNTNEILSLPEVSPNEMKSGDILVWGRGKDNPPRHYSVYLGNGEVMEVEGWGDKMRVVSIQHVMDEYDGMEVFRPKWNMLESRMFDRKIKYITENIINL